LHKFYDLPMARTSVIYNGVNHQLFYPLGVPERTQGLNVIKAQGIDKPYVLYVGTIEPRKNLQGILKAFAQLRQRTGFKGYLVVVGMKGWMINHIDPLIKDLGLTEAVKFLGYISDEQLRILYNLAQIFVFPSFYEGFGFPIIEAFACGVPVITSNTSSCAEMAGTNALTVDPNDEGALAVAMASIVDNQSLRDQLIARGIRRAQEFSFDQTAKQTLEVYSGLMK